MSLAKNYSEIAKMYDEHNFDGVIPSAQKIAFQQISDLSWDDKSIIDLGTGSGIFLQLIHNHFPTAKLTGVDISDKMLEIAAKKIKLTTICADISSVPLHVKNQQFDLAFAHYVLAYLPLSSLLNSTRSILSNDGLLSIITTTFESFPKMQDIMKTRFEKNNFLSRYIKRLHRHSIEIDYVPQSLQEIKQIISKSNFSIIKQATIKETIHFKNATEMAKWWINKGWLAETVSASHLPTPVFKLFFILGCKFFLKFPIIDQVVVEVLLIKQNSKNK